MTNCSITGIFGPLEFDEPLDPDETTGDGKAYLWDFSSFLDTGDAISTFSTTVDGGVDVGPRTGPTAASDGILAWLKVTTAVPGQKVPITIVVTTLTGLSRSQTGIVKIKEL